MVAEQEPVCRDSFVDEFTEVFEQAFIRGFAEVIGWQDNDAIEAQVKRGMGQRNGFGETGRPGSGEQFAGRTLDRPVQFTDLKRGAKNSKPFLR